MDAISSTETADQQLQKLQVDVVDEESQQQGHHKQQVTVRQVVSFVGIHDINIYYQIQASCWLRMEDDDDATVDILSGESGESTGTGLLVLGDVYAGHKQVNSSLSNF